MKWNYNIFDWCFNTSEFSPQKPETNHQTAQSLCKRRACRKTQLKVGIFVAFCDFRRVSLCATWLAAGGSEVSVYSTTLHRYRSLERREFYRATANAVWCVGSTNFPLDIVSCLFPISSKCVQEISTSNAKIVRFRFRPSPNVNGNALRLQICQFESDERHF